MRFVDTNVLLYAISREQSEGAKAKRANELLEDRDLGVSVQVLQEFYVQATRATRKHRLSHEQALGLVESFGRFRVQETSFGLVLAATATCERFGISYWDAAIIEAARSLGCETVFSEDMSDGQDYAGVRVANPFRAV